MLADVARMIVPDSVRSRVGCWAMLKAAQRDSWFKRYMKVVHGYDSYALKLLPNNEAGYRFGGSSIVFPRDGIGSCFEVFDERVYDRVNPVRHGDVVVDVGAYVGMFAIKVAHVASMVLAIEPNRDNANYIINNLVTSGIHNVQVVQQAVADRCGTGALHLHHMSSCHSLVYGGRSSTTVMVNTLDNICSEESRIGLVKIDAEGSELAVIRGGKDTLQRARSVVVAMYHQKEGNNGVAQVAFALGDLGFTVKVEKGLRTYLYGKHYAMV